MILALDPGPVETAWLELMPNGAIGAFGKEENMRVRARLLTYGTGTRCVVEMIASYGMAVGAEVFETCVWIGRFCETAESRMLSVERVGRKAVKQHLCGLDRAKDANIRMALLDRFGPGKEVAIGRKATPGPLYGVTADVWAALALAITYADTSPLIPTPAAPAFGRLRKPQKELAP